MNNTYQPKKSLVSSLFSKGEIYFAVCFLGIFLVTFIGLYLLGLMPMEFQSAPTGGSVALQNIEEGTKDAFGASGGSSSQAAYSSANPAALPVRIEIPTIGTNINIVNPTTTNTDTLDNDLADGAVHYPGSGMPGQGNMFIFGHSTSFQIVHNKAYQAFDNLSKLNVGDEIDVYSATEQYVYKVRTVNLENENQALVSFSGGTNMLTLSTCNSFGAKTDRYVVQADFVSSSAL
jgi:LPXTG-site transpeptidase (sortase) family protein